MSSHTPPTRKGFLLRIADIKALHLLVRSCGIYRACNFFLRYFPVFRRLPRHNTVLRLGSVSGLVLADEIFTNESYHDAMHGATIRTFADLGCNIGLFPCYLLETTGEKGFSGLLIDGNPDVVEQARWHMEKNGLTDCHVFYGVVGCPTESGETNFFINPANTQSSVRSFWNHPLPVKGRVKQIKVPTLSLAKTWNSKFGNTPIDLLKIDIEGEELEFLKAEIAFIKSTVKSIVCEWHKQHISFEELNQYVEANGFRLRKICEEDDKVGLVIYDSTNQNLGVENATPGRPLIFAAELPTVLAE